MIVEVDPEEGVFRKRAENDAEAARLEREAKALGLALHPGVVQMIGWAPATLTLRLVDGVALANLAGASTEDLTKIALSAATTVADLHDLGIVHGSLRPDHILVDRSGQAILCGFGSAGDGDPTGDVAALVNALLTVATAESRLGRALSDSAQFRRRSLTARQLAVRLAGSSQSPPGRRRRATPPSRPAARTATSRRTTVALGTRRTAAVNAAGGRRNRRSTLAVGALPAAVAAVAVVVIVALLSEAAHRLRRATPRVAPGAECPAVDRRCRPLVQADGLIDTPGGRYLVGAPGDVVVIGRWGCRTELPAVVRTTTGEVWVFDWWAAASRPVPARLVARIPGAHAVRVTTSASGCDALLVVSGVGAGVEIRPNQHA